MITDERDIAEILGFVRQAYSRIPVFIKPMIPALPRILRQIPQCAMKYTLAELAELLEDADAKGLM